MQGINKSWK